MFGGIGVGEVLIVLVIALVIFGPKRLPEAGRSLGRGLREFKDSISGSDRDELQSPSTTASTSAPTPAVTATTTDGGGESGNSAH